jgi:hypothetical protein
MKNVKIVSICLMFLVFLNLFGFCTGASPDLQSKTYADDEIKEHGYFIQEGGLRSRFNDLPGNDLKIVTAVNFDQYIRGDYNGPINIEIFGSGNDNIYYPDVPYVETATIDYPNRQGFLIATQWIIGFNFDVKFTSESTNEDDSPMLCGDSGVNGHSQIYEWLGGSTYAWHTVEDEEFMVELEYETVRQLNSTLDEYSGTLIAIDDYTDAYMFTQNIDEKINITVTSDVDVRLVISNSKEADSAAQIFWDTGTDLEYIHNSPPSEYTYYVIVRKADPETGVAAHYTLNFDIIPNAPAAPVISTLSQTINSWFIQLNWNTVSGATIYYVYGNDDYIGSTTVTNPFISFYEDGSYDIYVTAVNNSGESEKSNTITINVVPVIPGPPNATCTNSTFVFMNNENFKISWDPVPGATWYNIYDNGDFDTISASTSEIISTSGFTDGWHNITVTAQNATGEGPASNKVSIFFDYDGFYAPFVITANNTELVDSIIQQFHYNIVMEAVYTRIYVDDVLNDTSLLDYCSVFFPRVDRWYKISIAGWNGTHETPRSTIMLHVNLIAPKPAKPIIIQSDFTTYDSMVDISWEDPQNPDIKWTVNVYQDDVLIDNYDTYQPQKTLYLFDEGDYEIEVIAINKGNWAQSESQSDPSDRITINVNLNAWPSDTTPPPILEIVLIVAGVVAATTIALVLVKKRSVRGSTSSGLKVSKKTNEIPDKPKPVKVKTTKTKDVPKVDISIFDKDVKGEKAKLFDDNEEFDFSETPKKKSPVDDWFENP